MKIYEKKQQQTINKNVIAFLVGTKIFQTHPRKVYWLNILNYLYFLLFKFLFIDENVW